MSRPSPLSFARKKAWQRKRIVAPLRCRGLIDAFEKSFAKPLWKKFHWGFSFARKKAWQRKRIVAPLRCRGLIDAFEKSFAKKLNRVTPSTTCVRNMLSTYIGNRTIFFYGIKYGKREVFYVLTAVQRLHYSTERVILFPADKRKKRNCL
ncbi:MAG: hypothetical protein E7057_09285 [Lentisphaerae bacterium]|nr:hypothetical protein [Lentisphaerota bacterium]